MVATGHGLKDRRQRKTHLVGIRSRCLLRGRTGLLLLEAGRLEVGCFEEEGEEG